ncbi:MAG: GlsB/YeaQ/YmgE family stress response membrane protein [Lachnospiraceae bacterium]|nr:GlsB/YeaQ/YmgE family stress response membrane protein [Lachnospiraceae bacterium]
MDTIIGIIIDLIVGAAAGWLAGKIMHSEGSLLRNVILGIVGGVIGSILLGIIGIGASGIIGGIVVSVIGACALVALVRAITKK